MSIEVRFIDYTCARCDWGEVAILHGYDNVPPLIPLILVNADSADRQLEDDEPWIHECGAITTVKSRTEEIATVGFDGSRSIDVGSIAICTSTKTRKFITFEKDGQSWTWELFDAHWADDDAALFYDLSRIYVGRWPD